ncbi:alcohol dehydrogenase catalytic domain-containing protein [Isoptericola halotolerans]|uniref:alcohol dehydrogenase catalytic domain-containing protein n=1 Tax=Isoptericola halotolerans TaxID=300560 RepID=UPI00388DA929
MRALVARTGSSTPVLQETSPESLAPDEIRVAVRAAAVNPADGWVASGAARSLLDLPDVVVLGYDLVGTVTDVGAAVTDLTVGDVVAALHEDRTAPVRAHADVATVPAAAAAVVPAGLDPAGAASVPLNALTAAQGLDLLGPAEGRTLLVTGAAGGVGGYAVALAVRSGWRVTGLARAADEDFLRRAGAADTVTDVPGPVFDAVFDAAALQEGAIVATRDRGAFVGVLPPAPVAPERGITVAAVNVRADGERLAELLGLSREGVLEVRVAGEVSLDQAASAYDRRTAGGQRGRWLLVP